MGQYIIAVTIKRRMPWPRQFIILVSTSAFVNLVDNTMAILLSTVHGIFFGNINHRRYDNR